MCAGVCVCLLMLSLIYCLLLAISRVINFLWKALIRTAGLHQHRTEMVNSAWLVSGLQIFCGANADFFFLFVLFLGGYFVQVWRKKAIFNQTNWKNMLIFLSKMLHFVVNYELLLLQYLQYLKVLCIQKCPNAYYYYYYIDYFHNEGWLGLFYEGYIYNTGTNH